MGLNLAGDEPRRPRRARGSAGLWQLRELSEHAQTVEILGRTCRCVDLLALIRLKKAAGRPKNLETVAELEALREELGRQE